MSPIRHVGACSLAAECSLEPFRQPTAADRVAAAPRRGIPGAVVSKEGAMPGPVSVSTGVCQNRQSWADLTDAEFGDGVCLTKS